MGIAPNINLNALALHIADSNSAKGWHDRYKSLEMDLHAEEEERDHIASKLALIHSEVSEALEELRTGNPIDHRYEREDGKPEGFVVELADVLIRVLDLAGMLQLDLDQAVRDKLVFNESRPFKHGKAL